MLVWVCIAGLLIGGFVMGKARWDKLNRAGDVHFASVGGDQISMKVRGWTQPEIDKILADFCKSYDLSKAAIAADPILDDIIKLRFPDGLPADLLLYLVNYLHYPRAFDLNDRMIAVACDVTLTEAFRLPESDLIGRHATLYVPTDDQECDEIYASVESKGAFRISFTDLYWYAAADPRMSSTVKALRSSSED